MRFKNKLEDVARTRKWNDIFIIYETLKVDSDFILFGLHK